MAIHVVVVITDEHRLFHQIMRIILVIVFIVTILFAAQSFVAEALWDKTRSF